MVIGIQATLSSVHHIILIYISLAAFFTVTRSGNEGSVVDPGGISVVFISATPPAINQSQQTGTLFAETQSLLRDTLLERAIQKGEPDLREMHVSDHRPLNK